MVVIDNAARPAKELQCHLRRILNPLFMAATVIGASVRHPDKRVMAVKCVYFVLANAFLLVFSGVCVRDILSVITVCVAYRL